MLINIIGIASSTTCVVARTLHTVTSIAFDALGVPAKPVVNYLRHYDLFRKNIHPCIKTLYYITLSTLSEDFINKFTTSYLFATIGVVIFAKSWYNYTSNLPIKLYINHKYYQ